MHDMITKGKMASGDPVSWHVKVDPSIEGGVVYNLGAVSYTHLTLPTKA